MIYEFRTTIHGLDANVVGSELERIRESNDGRLRTEDIVREAATDSSPLHLAFTWDDAEAAHKQRLHEARYLVRNVLVIDPEAGRQPAYYNVSVRSESESDRYYQSIAVIAKSPMEYSSALALMQGKLSAAQEGLQHLLGLAPKSQHSRVRRASEYVGKAGKLLQSSLG